MIDSQTKSGKGYQKLGVPLFIVFERIFAYFLGVPPNSEITHLGYRERKKVEKH